MQKMEMHSVITATHFTAVVRCLAVNEAPTKAAAATLNKILPHGSESSGSVLVVTLAGCEFRRDVAGPC